MPDQQPDLAWAIDRLTQAQAIAEIGATRLGPKLLRGHGYPNEVMHDAQDALAFRLVLDHLRALKQERVSGRPRP